MTHLKQDIHHTFRTFRKSPLFVAVAVLSLALGIGANTAIFTLVDQLLLRLLPVRDPQQLVLLWGRGPHYGSNNGRYKLSYPMYEDFRDHNDVFSGMFCRWATSINVSRDGKSERVDGELVSGTYFQMLGVQPALGRVFTPEDDRTTGAAPYAVLSYRYWLSRYAGSPDAIGKKILVNGYPLTIVGVSQAGFDGTDIGTSPAIRVPIMMKIEMDPVGAGFNYNFKSRRGRWINVFGRLKPSVTLEHARAALQPYFHQMLEMEAQQKEFAKAAPEVRQNFLTMWLDLLPAAKGESELRRRFSGSLIVLMAIVGLVLLIACANVANLLLARATARQKEIAIRLALGAGRRRIVAQLLVESLILSLAGGAAGLALAVWIDRTLVGFVPAGASPTISTTPDWRILAFNLAISLLTGIVFGLVPALQAARPQLAATLKDQAGSIAGGTSIRLRKTLVGAQVAVSLLLLVGAGLFIRTLSNLKDLDPGFQTSNLIGFSVDPTGNGYPRERSLDFYRQLRENLTTLPGVDAAAFAVVPVLSGDEWDQSISIEGFVHKPTQAPDPHMQFISPEYFKTLNIPILTGRDFRATDVKGAAKVCIVNEKFARTYFKDGEALGRHIGMGGNPGTPLDIEIVGIARDTKYESMRAEVPMPYTQTDFVVGMTTYVRTTRQPEQAMAAVRKAVNRLDSTLPVSAMKTLETEREESLITERLVATLSSAFGVLATLLAAIGLYGVMAYLVAQRTREIGIRMALGAKTADVVWLVMKDVLMLAGIGVAIGLSGAYALTRFAQSQLYGIQPNDTLTILTATLAITMVSVTSGYLPARRATRVDPILALRSE